MIFELSETAITNIPKYLQARYSKFNYNFITKTHNLKKTALQYTQGIMLQKGRGNMREYANNVKGARDHRFHHFISESPWEYRPIIEEIQQDIMEEIGDGQNGAIHIDETCFPKSGNDSVGVKRQYCGRLGKVENCQVAVCLGYSNGSNRALIDIELYLPEEWAEDQERRNKCGVPEDLKFKPKAEIGLELIRAAIANGVKFGWVGMDSFYGRQIPLLNAIDSDGIVYIADIPSDTRVWLSLPQVGIPERKSNVGRIPTELKVLSDESRPIEVRNLINTLDQSQWNHTFVRDTERRELWARIACLQVYVVDDKLPGKKQWLIIRIDDNDGATKFQLSNAPMDTTVERFAQMSCSRYWIERAFEDEKGLAGLADFQGRGWIGWHHHMTMSLFAMMMMLSLSIKFKDYADLLTVQDIKNIYEKSFARGNFSTKEVINLLKKRHKARESAKKSHHRAPSIKLVMLAGHTVSHT